MRYRINIHPTLATLLMAGLVLLVGACSDTARSTNGEEGPQGAEVSEHPGESLVGEEDGRVVVELTGAKAAAAGLESVKVSITSLPGHLATTGQVDFNQDRLAHVSARLPGRVAEARARLGQQVRRGEILAMLDSIELGRAKAEYLQATAHEQLTRENYEREENLFEDRISSEKETLVAKAQHIEAEASLRRSRETLLLYGLSDEEVATVTYENPGRSLLPIRAPLSGKIVEKHLTIGELVTPETNLFSLADLSEVWVWIDIYERDLQQVHLGDQADVQVDAFPDREFGGTVSYLSDSVDLDTRRIRARIDVENPGEELRPGMFAKVELTDPHEGGSDQARAPTLVVPRDSIQRDGDSRLVFVDLGEGRYERREVQLGRESRDLVEVLGGLNSGESIVSAGTFFLKTELAKDELGEGDEH